MSGVSHVVLSDLYSNLLVSGQQEATLPPVSEVSNQKLAQAMDVAREQDSTQTQLVGGGEKGVQGGFIPQKPEVIEPQNLSSENVPQVGASASPDSRGSSMVDLDQSSRERVRKTLGFDLPAAPAGTGGGDLILQGLQKLRGVFDKQTARINGIMSGDPVANASTLFKMQVEVVQYTLLIDIAGKLVGKTTQSFDSLMKGQ